MRIRHKSRHPAPLASNRRRIAIYSTTSHLLHLSDPDQPVHHLSLSYEVTQAFKIKNFITPWLPTSGSGSSKRQREVEATALINSARSISSLWKEASSRTTSHIQNQMVIKVFITPHAPNTRTRSTPWRFKLGLIKCIRWQNLG